MLFVHGFPECWFSWRFQMQEFSRDYRWTLGPFGFKLFQYYENCTSINKNMSESSQLTWIISPFFEGQDPVYHGNNLNFKSVPLWFTVFILPYLYHCSLMIYSTSWSNFFHLLAVFGIKICQVIVWHPHPPPMTLVSWYNFQGCSSGYERLRRIRKTIWSRKLCDGQTW